MAWLVGCASAPRVVVVEPVGPPPSGGAQELGDGSLVIYSARTKADVGVNEAEWRYNNDLGKNDFLFEPAHTDYVIYTQRGEVFRRVRNARGPSDETPAQVRVPAGSYRVAAEGLSCDSSRVALLISVVVKSGQTTIAHLDGDWNPLGQFDEPKLARLPCGRIIGWRAAEPGLAMNQSDSQSN